MKTVKPKITTKSCETSDPSPELQAVADFFIIKSNETSRVITNKKLQKLAYYAQAWNLVFNDGRTIYSEPIEAWIHGPAIRKLYSKYKAFGYSPITVTPKSDTLLPKDATIVLSDVWGVYGKFDGDYLEALTHKEQPWIEARGNAEVNQPTDITISTDSMKLFYAARLREAQAS